MLPIVLYQAYAFLVPAIGPRERKLALPLLLMVPVLFIGGVVFCYLVVLPPAARLPPQLQRVGVQHPAARKRLLRLRDPHMLAMGLGFQVPVGVLALTRLGVVSVDKLRRSRRYAILAIAVLAALLPTLDPITLVLEMVPLLLLYEASIQLARFFAPQSDAGSVPAT